MNALRMFLKRHRKLAFFPSVIRYKKMRAMKRSEISSLRLQTMKVNTSYALKQSFGAIVAICLLNLGPLAKASMPEHVKASLNRMVGDWVLTTELGDRTVSETVTFESRGNEDVIFYEVIGESFLTGEPTRMTGIFAWDEQARKVMEHGFTHEGGTLTAKHDITVDGWTDQVTRTHFMDGRHVSETVDRVFTFQSADRFTLVWKNRMVDGNSEPGMMSVFTRQKIQQTGEKWSGAVKRGISDLSTEFLMTLHAPLDPAQAIDAALMIYNVREGGWVKGPRIEGKLKAPAADWLRILPDGTMRLDVRGTIETADGALIYINYGGVIRHTEVSQAKEQSGEIIAADEMYFVISVNMRTSDERYLWVNQAQYVGKMSRAKEGAGSFVEYDIFAVK